MRYHRRSIRTLRLGVLVVGLAVVAVLLSGRHATAQSPAAQTPPLTAPPSTIAFLHVAVVPMDTDRVLPDHAVVIKDGRIAAVGPMNRIEIPSEALRVDGRGKYLIPGLADMHVHLLMFKGPNGNSSPNPEQMLLGFLAQGVTTIRNMDYDKQSVGQKALALRARAAAGELLSPRIYTAGPWMTERDASFSMTTDTGWSITPAEVATRIAAYKAAGYDFIKPYFEGPEIFDSVVAAARRLGIPVAGHVPYLVSIRQALTARMQSIEHLTGYTDYLKLYTDSDKSEGIAHLAHESQRNALAKATRQAGTWNCPTLIAVEYNFRGFMRSLPEVAPQLARTLPMLQSPMRQFVKALQDEGAGLLLGTDAGGLGDIKVVEELQELTRAGLTPYQALVTGTRNVAAYFGTLDSTGTVTVGKRADLVLLNGNPLQDVQHAAAPVGTMLGGRWLPREELARLQTATAQSSVP